MWKSLSNTPFLAVLIFSSFFSVTSAMTSNLVVPSEAHLHGTAKLICTYRIQNDTLYNLQWYKGNNEFFRYTPRNHPSIKYFPMEGIDVDEKSNGTHIILKNLTTTSSGMYGCIVSTEYPHLETIYKQIYMEVIDPSTGSGEKIETRTGDQANIGILFSRKSDVYGHQEMKPVHAISGEEGQTETKNDTSSSEEETEGGTSKSSQRPSPCACGTSQRSSLLELEKREAERRLEVLDEEHDLEMQIKRAKLAYYNKKSEMLSRGLH